MRSRLRWDSTLSENPASKHSEEPFFLMNLNLHFVDCHGGYRTLVGKSIILIVVLSVMSDCRHANDHPMIGFTVASPLFSAVDVPIWVLKMWISPCFTQKPLPKSWGNEVFPLDLAEAWRIYRFRNPGTRGGGVIVGPWCCKTKVNVIFFS